MIRAALIASILFGIMTTLAADDQGPLYLILGAVPQETKPIVAALADREKGELAGLEYHVGKLGKNRVVVSLTGVGKSYTGMVTALFLQEFKPDAAFMTGTGARINSELRTGDVILPTNVFLHDYGSLGEAGIAMAGLQPPSVPNEAPLLENDFEITPRMHAKALTLVEGYEKHAVLVDGVRYGVEIGPGRVTSGDFFGVPQNRIDALREMDVDIMEMESATFALVCGHFGTPFLVVRSGSNLAQATPSDDYLTYGPIAAYSSAKTTTYLVSNW